MAVLKSYVADSNTSVSKIITLDEKYDSYLQEAAQHKSRAKTVKEHLNEMFILQNKDKQLAK